MTVNDELRARLSDVIAERDDLSESGWAKKAKISPSSFREFMKGPPDRSINWDTLCALAFAADMSVAQLLNIHVTPVNAKLLSALYRQLAAVADPSDRPEDIAQDAAEIYADAESLGVDTTNQDALKMAVLRAISHRRAAS